MLHWLFWCGYVMPQYEWMTAESLLKWNQTVGLGTKSCLFAAVKLFEIGEVTLFGDLKYICHESDVLLCWTHSMVLLFCMAVVWWWRRWWYSYEKNSVEDLQGCLWMVVWQLWWYKSPEQIWDAIFQTRKQQEGFPRTLSSKSVIYIKRTLVQVIGTC